MLLKSQSVTVTPLCPCSSMQPVGNPFVILRTERVFVRARNHSPPIKILSMSIVLFGVVSLLNTTEEMFHDELYAIFILPLNEAALLRIMWKQERNIMYRKIINKITGY